MKKQKAKLPQPDTLIIQQCKKGNAQAFGSVVDMYQDIVRQLIYRFVFDNTITNDLAQTAFIKIWQNINKYKETYTFSTWMYKIVVNTCLDYIKSNKLRETEVLEAGYEAKSANLEVSVENKDLVKRIKHMSRQLSAQQRVVFVLKDLQDWSMEEVSIAMNLSTGAVKSNLYYARKYIREQVLKLEKLEGIQ